MDYSGSGQVPNTVAFGPGNVEICIPCNDYRLSAYQFRKQDYVLWTLLLRNVTERQTHGLLNNHLSLCDTMCRV